MITFTLSQFIIDVDDRTEVHYDECLPPLNDLKEQYNKQAKRHNSFVDKNGIGELTTYNRAIELFNFINGIEGYHPMM